MLNEDFIILKKNKWQKLEIFLCIITLGLFYLFFKLFFKIKIKLFYVQTNLKYGKFIKFNKSNELFKIKKIKLRNIIYFTFKYQKIRYFIKANQYFRYEIQKIKSPFKGKNYNEIIDEINYLKSLKNSLIKKVYGNSFLKIGDENIFIIFLKEFNSLIYYFQILCVIVWILDKYLPYSLLIISLTLLSLVISSFEQYKSIKNINKMANEKFEYEVKDKNNEWKMKNSFELVVGDIIKIKENLKINNDIILLNGFSYVNESNLTGESKPILKKPFKSNKDVFNSKFKNNLILSGSTIISTDLSFCEGVVYKVGFNTIKGKIIKNILFQKDHNKNLIKDSYKFLLFLLVINIFSIIYYIIKVMVIKEKKNTVEHKSIYSHIIKILEIFTTIIPAALPLFLNECLRISKKILEKKKIFCLNISKINQCARVNKICFDKTGTLTSEKLEVVEIFINDSKKIDIKDNNDFKLKLQNLILNDNKFFDIFYNLAINIGINNCLFQKDNGEILGSSLDKTLFELSKFKITFNNPKITEYNVNEFFGKSVNKPNINKLKIFEFTSKLKRMGVIAKVKNKYFLYIKGAFEFIHKFLNKKSIPDNLIDYIDKNSQEGYRLIVTCYREITEKDIKKDLEDLEFNMIFSGLIIFRNSLKKKTKRTIIELKKNNIKSIMITGDNILTAVNIAIKSEINSNNNIYIGSKNENDEIIWKDFKNDKNQISTDILINSIENKKNFQVELAAESKIYHELKKNLNYEEFISIFKNIIIFARTSPFDKEEIVSILKDLNKENKFNIGFVGDGNNDCLALKKADIGLSLSTNESSLSSPFTYTKENISGIIKLIIEGKNCLESSFQSFLFLIYYSFSQFNGLMILYLKFLDYSNFHYYYMDIILSILIPYAITSIKSNKKLNSIIPNFSWFNKKIIFSLLGTIIINIVVFFVADILSNQNIKTTYNIKQKRTFIFFIANTLIFFEGICVIRTYPYRSKIKLKSNYFISFLILFFLNWMLILQPFRSSYGNGFSRFLDYFFIENQVSILTNELLIYYFILSAIIFISLFVLHKVLNKIYIN